MAVDSIGEELLHSVILTFNIIAFLKVVIY